jgi:hypothetical protein
MKSAAILAIVAIVVALGTVGIISAISSATDTNAAYSNNLIISHKLQNNLSLIALSFFSFK